MGKFFRLVNNEYIKLLKKTSTKILLVLIVLAVIGFSLINFLSKSITIDDDPINYDYSEQISWLNETKPDDYQAEIIFDEFLADNKVRADSVYYNTLNNIYQIVKTQNVDIKSFLYSAIDSSSWKEACQELNEFSALDGDKWQYQYRLDNNIPFGDNWKNSVIQDISEAKNTLETLSGATSNAKERENYEKIEKICIYRLENNIEIDASEYDLDLDTLDSDAMDYTINFWSVFFQSSSLVSIIGLIMIIIAGSCVSNEFSQSTYKLLLINPIKRYKILMSKYFTVISFGYILLVLLFLLMIPFDGLFMGFKDISSAAFLLFKDGIVKEISPFLMVAKNYLLSSVEIVIFATIAFTLSSLFKSSALAIGCGVFCMFGGNALVGILSMLNQDWGRYLIFANLDLASIANGITIFPQQSITFAVCNIIIHMFVFLLIAWDGFTKREC